MELDFSRLTNLGQERARRDFKPATPENRPAEIDCGGILGKGEYQFTSTAKKPVESPPEPPTSIRILQDREEARKRDHEREIQVYKDHQEAIKATSEAQAAILKGLRSGADPVGLLLQAIEAISKMTGNKLFYTQARGDLIAIYGEAMLEPLPIQWEIDETMQRFEKILAAMSREHDPDAQARIEAAAKAHYAKLERLQALLDEAQAKPKAVPAGSV